MWWDIFLALVAFACLFIGFIGAILPLPGPPLSYVGLLLLHATRFADYSSGLLWGLGLATLVVVMLDYYIPIWGLKKFGGSRAGIWGSTIGLVVGMFLGPAGVFIGAFAGGLLGELAAGRDSRSATRAAAGSFAGFMLGVGLKIALCGLMIWYAGSAMAQYTLAGG
ncbi:MAG: DUF456 domain-containing protein [Bacteroidetes bacterium]|nr:MAG: DUF456 domain-containing protein [Bacteroidota bacterium]